MNRAKFLAVAAAALTVGLTACSPGGSGEQSTVNNAQPSVVQEDSGVSAVDSPASDETQDETSSSAVTPPPETPVGDPLCKAPDLALSFGESDGATGGRYAPLIFTNISSHNCVIQGFPGVSYVGGDDGHQVGADAYRDGKKGGAVNMAPGDKASAMIKFTTVENYDPAECRLEVAKGLRIYPPQETASLFIPFDYEQHGCANAEKSQLSVQTIQAGVSQ
ncbi:DUF4232 domain-containing protein [Saccharopolyspora indica]|uniref:DUF4232 domain-containing protein n=1 Tax=Saccharopolyspora indica TaxID=1229659 RepID=UPI0022EABAC2|nr:DUF4232 domain-containing protein [Saccharopolyspora indica]MDA3650155.1 DUF4232 domain-containing protein [Saccharopolyspora indica]